MKTKNMGITKTYIAGPFFNKDEIEIVENIKNILNELKIVYYSPKDECLIKKRDSLEKIKYAYDLNLKAMDDCDLMIANIEGFDTGTIFEMGYFTKSNKPIIAFSSNPDRKLNIMLSQSCIGFSNAYLDLKNIIYLFNENKYEKKEFAGEHF